MKDEPTSRIPGFYRRPVLERRTVAAGIPGLDEGARRQLVAGGLTLEVADMMSENVVSTHGLPLSLALNFRVNGRDHLVPMAIEEPSVVAAASNAARLVRLSGGFQADVDDPVMTAQVHLAGVPNPLAAADALAANRDEVLALADAAIPRMVRRGGGARNVELRVLDADDGLVVVDTFVDVRDAMGANVVDTVAETIAPLLEAILGGRAVLRILSNLPLRRLARARCWVSDEVLGSRAAADGVLLASRFAELDPLRAVTHNKGIMNGIDAVAIATGQDFRAIEAGAHAYAAHRALRDGGPDGGVGYSPLSIWRRRDQGIEGEIEMPIAVGTVGGSVRAHPGVRAALQIAGVEGAEELAALLICAGLASNLAALKALSGEGIQKGHMRLHGRRTEATWREEQVGSDGANRHLSSGTRGHLTSATSRKASIA